VLDSAVVGISKPDPIIFELALEAVGVDAAHAVFVGDTPTVDVRGARAAGVAPILVDPYDLHDDVDCPPRAIPGGGAGAAAHLAVDGLTAVRPRRGSEGPRMVPQ